MVSRPAVSTITTSRPSALGLGHAPSGHLHRVASARVNTADTDGPPEDAELLDGGRPLEVGADQQRVATLLLEPAGQLRGGGRLAGALEPGEQHDRRRTGGVGEAERLTAQGGGELLVDDLDDLLGGGEAPGELGPGATQPDPLDEVADDLQADVGLEEGDPDLAQHLGDVGVAEAAASAKAREDPVEAVGEGLEHGHDKVTRPAIVAR